MTGGTEFGFYEFLRPPHDWEPKAIDVAMGSLADIFGNLTYNLKLSSIPQLRRDIILERIPVSSQISAIMDLLPKESFVPYGVEQMAEFDNQLYHLRDSRESLPHEKIILALWDSSTILTL